MLWCGRRSEATGNLLPTSGTTAIRLESRSRLGESTIGTLGRNALRAIRRCRSEAIMRRREFVRLIGSAAFVWPVASQAQQPRMARIGALLIGNADAESFRKELRQ